MKHLKITGRVAALVMLTLLLAQSGHGAGSPLPSTALGVQGATGEAPGSASYDLSWWTVDGGGGVNSGGDYTLSGSIGQADAGPALGGGSYTLVGGFWQGAGSPAPEPDIYIIYLPLALRNF